MSMVMLLSCSEVRGVTKAAKTAHAIILRVLPSLGASKGSDEKRAIGFVIIFETARKSGEGEEVRGKQD